MDINITNIETLKAFKSDDVRNKLFLDGKDTKGIDEKKLRKLGEDKEGLKEVSKAFEGIFVNMLLKEMRGTVNSDSGMLPKSNEREFFEEMLDEKMAEEMSKKESLGISDAVIRSYGERFENENSLELNFVG